MRLTLIFIYCIFLFSEDSKTFNFNPPPPYVRREDPLDIPRPPSRPSSDIYSISSKHTDFNKGLSPRETFERKHKLTSSLRNDSNKNKMSKGKGDNWSPSYV